VPTMPYAIIKRENYPYDIVIRADSLEKTHSSALRLMGMEISDVSGTNKELYETSGTVRVNNEITIKNDSFNLTTYNKRGVAMWLTEKTVKESITPKFELKYFMDHTLVSHNIYRFRFYDSIRNAILEELEEMTHEEKIERLIEIINERYYNRYGFDEYGRYNSDPKDFKAPYNFFENF
jgi:hypothetical protein